MKEIDLKTLTIQKAQDGMESGEFSAEELTGVYLTSIKVKNPELNAYLSVFDDAINEAKEIDQKRARGEKLGTLAGIPIAIKDVIMVKGREVRAASKVLSGHIATYDATAVVKLHQAGAVLLGMTNADEFAMGASNENSAYGPCRNPHDPSRVSGGSSGGSACAVAADMALAALGSETGGSVRYPAALCGIVGLKPTYGAVSRYGLMPMASSFNQIAPAAKTVADTETIFNIIRGRDDKDANSLEPVFANSPNPKIIGVPNFSPEGMDERVRNNYELSVERLGKLGYEMKEVKLESLRYAVACYYILVPAEVSADMARFDGVRYGAHIDGANLLEDYGMTRGVCFGKEVRRRVILGTYVLSAGYYDAYYYKAARVRELIRRDFVDIFKQVDAIVMPTSPRPAYKLGEISSNPLLLYLEDIFTAPANLAYIPAISVPSGTVREDDVDLPLGLQIIAPHLREDVLFDIGKKFLGEK